MSFEDDEAENYEAKYGCIDLNDEHFDDHPELGPDYLEYRISKIKIWTPKKNQYTVLGGIQTCYINNKNGSSFITKENKGEKVEECDFVEFNLEENEYITNGSLWFEEGSICKVIFKTNLNNTFSVGDAKGDEMIIDEFNKSKNKFLLSFFGTFSNKYLTSIGLFINKEEEFFNYFIRGYFELKIVVKNEKEKIEEKIKNNEFGEKEKILVKACKLPNYIFREVIKYINPLIK